MLPIRLSLYCVEKTLKNSSYFFSQSGHELHAMCSQVSFNTRDLQSCADDLTVIIFDKFQKFPFLAYFRGEPTLFDKSFLSLLEPPTTGVATRTLTETPSPVIVTIRFAVAPAPVPIGLVAELDPLPPPALAVSPVPSVAPDRANGGLSGGATITRAT